MAQSDRDCSIGDFADGLSRHKVYISLVSMLRSNEAANHREDGEQESELFGYSVFRRQSSSNQVGIKADALAIAIRFRY